MWWSKPKDVFVPIILNIDCTLEGLLAMVGPQIPDAKSEAANWNWSPLEKFDNLRPNFTVDVGQYLPRPFVPEEGSFELSQLGQKVRFRNDRLPPYERDWLLGHFLGVLSLLFGAVYIAGWNISFPTHTERIVWRVCTLMTFSLVVVFWAVDAAVELHQRKEIKKVPGNEKVALTPVKMALYVIISMVYVAIRLYILIEPFVCLRSLPPSAFETVQWSSFIPHF